MVVAVVVVVGEVVPLVVCVVVAVVVVVGEEVPVVVADVVTVEVGVVRSHPLNDVSSIPSTARFSNPTVSSHLSM